MKRTLLALAMVLVGSSCSFTDPTSDAPAAGADLEAAKKAEAAGKTGAVESLNRIEKKKLREKRRILSITKVEAPDAKHGGVSTGDRKSGGPTGGRTETGSAAPKLGGELQRPGEKEPRPSGPASTVSRVSDPVPDAETRGEAPDYIEIAESSITGHPNTALFSITFNGEIPGRMPDAETVAYVGFSLRRKGRDLSVNASCERDGWRANVNGSNSFPGSFSIRGKTLSMSVPWESIGGKKAFDWRADSSWTRSTTLDTHYGFDSAPNDHDKRYR